MFFWLPSLTSQKNSKNALPEPPWPPRAKGGGPTRSQEAPRRPQERPQDGSKSRPSADFSVSKSVSKTVWVQEEAKRILEEATRILEEATRILEEATFPRRFWPVSNVIPRRLPTSPNPLRGLLPCLPPSPTLASSSAHALLLLLGPVCRLPGSSTTPGLAKCANAFESADHRLRCDGRV